MLILSLPMHLICHRFIQAMVVSSLSFLTGQDKGIMGMQVIRLQMTSFSWRFRQPVPGTFRVVCPDLEKRPPNGSWLSMEWIFTEYQTQGPDNPITASSAWQKTKRQEVCFKIGVFENRFTQTSHSIHNTSWGLFYLFVVCHFKLSIQ